MRVCPPKTLNSGWTNSKVGGANLKKIGAVAPIPLLPTLFRKRAGAPGFQNSITNMVEMNTGKLMGIKLS